MKTTTQPGLIGLGSARVATRADGPGDQMELVPIHYYDTVGVRADPVSLGSARDATRAVDRGDITELNPLLFWDVPGAVRA